MKGNTAMVYKFLFIQSIGGNFATRIMPEDSRQFAVRSWQPEVLRTYEKAMDNRKSHSNSGYHYWQKGQ